MSLCVHAKTRLRLPWPVGQTRRSMQHMLSLFSRSISERQVRNIRNMSGFTEKGASVLPFFSRGRGALGACVTFCSSLPAVPRVVVRHKWHLKHVGSQSGNAGTWGARSALLPTDDGGGAMARRQ